MAGITIVDDVTRTFIGSAPSGVKLAGYTTGSGGIAWGAQDWAAHPDAIRIDQDARAADVTADVLDVEAGAATFAECAAWAKKALANFAAGVRPGQRRPVIYMSLANVTSVTDALKAGGVTGGVGLWVADWTGNQAAAIAAVNTGGGPFPIVGWQWKNGSTYDMDVFSTDWWSTRSGTPVPEPAFPLSQGMRDTGATGLVRTLQERLVAWKFAAADPKAFTVDGIYGPATAVAVTQAQQHFGEHGVAAGTCTQALSIDLSAAPPPVVPPVTPPVFEIYSSTTYRWRVAVAVDSSGAVEWSAWSNQAQFTVK